MSQWVLVDGRDAVEEEEDFPKVLIHSEDQLREELNRQAAQPPGMVGLISPAEGWLDIAIGGPWAGLVWNPPPPEQRHRGYLVAQSNLAVSSQPVEFVSEGVPAPFDPKELFPVQEVIDAVVYYYKNHRVPEWLQWRAWNPAAKRWEMTSSNGSPQTAPALGEAIQQE